MDLLPKDHKEFQKQEYWTKFFSDKKTQQGFEWYASYEELEYYLKHTLKDKEQRVMVTGCGNSLLSEKMHKKLNFTNKVHSIDFEESIIKKMNNRGYEGVEYHVMDALNMTFEPASFDYVIDKGTLDALCADRSGESANRVVAYFNQIIKVLSVKGGTYICVSLLQDFVLDALITFFSKGFGNEYAANNIFEFRIQKIDKLTQKATSDGQQLLPFFVTIKRTQIPQDPKFEELRVKMSEAVYFQDSSLGKAEMQPISGIHERVKKEQITQMFIPKMKELNLAQQYELFCFDKNQKTDIPRYTLTVIDSNDAKILKKRTCAAFITPQGKERDTMISTEIGKVSLCQQAGYSRLIIITLNHGHKFDSIETVKTELSPKVVELAPQNCSNYKEIPFLTIGQDIGQRQEVYRSADGSIFVEDLKDGGESNEYYRQVIFSSKPEQIQSEVILAYRNSKKEGGLPEHVKATSPIAPKKKQRVLVYNHDLLCCEYQYAMLAGPALSLKIAEKTGLRVLVLGTGAGLLPMFLRGQLGDKLAEIITVDINSEVLKIAKEYCGFLEDDKLKSVIADAYRFVNDYQVTPATKFDMIFMDINYEEDNIQLSPPRKFLSQEFLAKLLVSDQSCFIVLLGNDNE